MSKEINEMKVTLSSLKEKIKKMAKMCESTDFKQNDAYEILSDGLIDIIDIKTLNNKIQFNVEDSKNECMEPLKSLAFSVGCIPCPPIGPLLLC